MSAELAELRGEQQRAAESLGSASERLAEAPPARLQKKLENQQEVLSASLRQVQEELGEARRTFERAEAGSTKERRQLIKAAQDEKATALAASELERHRAEQRTAELERELLSAETAAQAAIERANSNESHLGELRMRLAHHEATEAARLVAEQRWVEVSASYRAMEALAARQAVHCSVLGESIVEAERDDCAREWDALEAANRAAVALVASATRQEERRARAHAEWLAATEAVVPTIATSAHALVDRLDAATERAEGISAAVEGWRGRALLAEASADAADEKRVEAEVVASALKVELARQTELSRQMAQQVRLLTAELHEAESEGQELRMRESAAKSAAADNAAAVREMAPLHDSVVALVADLLAPMRVLELEATGTALRDAEALAAANARAAQAEIAARQAFTSAEAAWREERVVTAAAREAAASDARQAVAQAS